jgi:hypothetical protein
MKKWDSKRWLEMGELVQGMLRHDADEVVVLVRRGGSITIGPASTAKRQRFFRKTEVRPASVLAVVDTNPAPKRGKPKKR